VLTVATKHFVKHEVVEPNNPKPYRFIRSWNSALVVVDMVGQSRKEYLFILRYRRKAGLIH
jgi:hypothetical protein